MKTIRFLTSLGVVAAIWLLAVIPVGAAPARTYVYTVKLGDTLATISRKFGVSADVILDVNKLRNRPDLIYVDEKITLPIILDTKPSYVNAFLYVVQTGDTVQTLNNKFYIDRYTVRQVNGIPADANVLTPGATILIPAGPHRYTVQTGDTVQAIAIKFGTTVNTILKFNAHLGGGTSLAAGMNVYIPIVYNAPYTPIGGAAATVGEGVGGGGEGTTGGAVVGNPATGLKPTDVVDAKAFNANVISAFQTITMPQNVVNLNQPLEIRWEQLRRVRRDPTRDNGAIATIAVQFRGGTGTVVVQHWDNSGAAPTAKGLPISGIYVNAGDKELWNDIEVEVPATCSASLQDQLIITSGIKLEAHLSIWIDCPK
jgi:LysM repeat protein